MLGLPSCKEVTELSSKMLDEDVAWWERATLRIHLMMCDQCRRYQQHMKLTSQSVGYWMKGRKMPENLKQQLLEDFKQHSDCQHK
ncbi:MAG: zf-HC2 domain-containing protein [Kangiellaceae bacterium]|jgi:hypothetical protein|nr:zf-HC2 domain-containing protein [Kangiellaceae bacterium]